MNRILIRSFTVLLLLTNIIFAAAAESDNYMNVEITKGMLGEKITMNTSSVQLLKLVSKTLERDSNEMELHTLAYCVKTNLREVPSSIEELLLYVHLKGAKSSALLILVKSGESWELLGPPTHNSQLESVAFVEQLASKETLDFLEQSTFGFYDFIVRDREVLYIAEQYADDLNVLKKPLSDARRQGRLPLFVPPGP